MERIAIYGKGGIGKSVVATNLSARYALGGRRVLHIGCDPKCDSAIRLLDAGRPVTVLDLVNDGGDEPQLPSLINRGRHGIDCIEAGGPDPGTGCAGRGVARTIEILGESRAFEHGSYDVAVFDVLGDVVCGGFAAPLRLGFARKVLLVVSDQPMSLFAANNITRAIHRYHANGVALAGIVANSVTTRTDRSLYERFARALNTQVLAYVPWDAGIVEAEKHRRTVTEWAAEGAAARALGELAERVWALDPEKQPLPRTLTDDEFFAFLQEDS